jgi:hypothetical protein
MSWIKEANVEGDEISVFRMEFIKQLSNYAQDGINPQMWLKFSSFRVNRKTQKTELLRAGFGFMFGCNGNTART